MQSRQRHLSRHIADLRHHAVQVVLDVVDPYKVQLEAFLKAVRSSDEQALKSNYADAFLTHKAVLDIVNACDGHKYIKLPLEQ